MFLIQKFCRDFNLDLKEAYRKAVQESRGAVEDEEEEGAKADNKEQVIKIIFRMVEVIFMRIVTRIARLTVFLPKIDLFIYSCGSLFSESWESQTEAGYCNEPRTKPGDFFQSDFLFTIKIQDY